MSLGPRAALAHVALGAFCISFAAIFVRWIPLGPATIGFGRTAFAALALALAALVGVPGSRRLADHAPLSLPALAWSALAGLFFAADLFVWHQSIRLTGAGMATLLANTQVFWVATLSALLLGERLSGRFAAAAAAALIGVGLLTWPGLAKSAIHAEGVVLGLATGLFYGGYYLSLRESRRRAGAPALVPNLAISSAVCAAALAAAAVVEGEPLALPPLAELGKLALLGTCVHAAGWLLISRGMAHVAASRGSLALLLQPVLATLWGIALYDEPFGPIEGGGALLTLAAIYAASRERG